MLLNKKKDQSEDVILKIIWKGIVGGQDNRSGFYMYNVTALLIVLH